MPLTELDHAFNPRVVHSVPPQNVNPGPPAAMTPELEDLILESERELIARFYSGGNDELSGDQ